MSEWEYSEAMRFWSLRHGNTQVTIEHRPAYCDRGHYVAKVFGLEDVDWADGFPRYFMNLDRAKLEMMEWLVWRLNSIKQL
jgi:hypothetical protein